MSRSLKLNTVSHTQEKLRISICNKIIYIDNVLLFIHRLSLLIL